MKTVAADDVVPGLDELILAAIKAVDFNGMIAAEQAGRIPLFDESLKQDEHGEAWIINTDSSLEHPFGQKTVMDILIYPMVGVDYEAKYGKSSQELNTELITKVGAEMLRPLIAAGQIHAIARGLSLTGDRPATYIRVFRAQDFPCSEHSEMLLGQPLGQYHCPACGEMQVAGCFHLPREFDDEGKLIDA